MIQNFFNDLANIDGGDIAMIILAIIIGIIALLIIIAVTILVLYFMGYIIVAFFSIFTDLVE